MNKRTQRKPGPLTATGTRYSAMALAAALYAFGLLGVDTTVLAAQGRMTVSGRHYVEDRGDWFMEANGRRFRVVPDVVSVKFRAAVEPAAKAQVYAQHRTRARRQNLLGIVDLEVPSGKNPIEFVRQLQATGLFEFVEVNTFGEYVMLPNDSLFSNQWGLHNTGQTGGTPDADIDAPEAWDRTTGSPNVIVAVLDSGTDIDHQDLNCNIWVNPGEDLDGDRVVWDPDDMNGIDDDGNGLVDDLVGWDFGNNNNDPRGSFDHGTHVAGTAGACSNNTIGVSGVAGGWGTQAGTQLLTIGVGDASPNGAVLDDAIIYATTVLTGTHTIITMSLTVGPSTAIDQALDFAYSQGVFINDAAGNSDAAVAYPATHPKVVAVGATDDDDNRASFSNHGPELEIVAPGVNIWSTLIGNTYGSLSGTSMASPHVAGVAALMFAANPAVTNEEVRQCLQQTADDQVGNPVEDTPGRDNFYGFGRLNARAAVDCITGITTSKTYDTWLSRSFTTPPFTPFHDCVSFTADTMTTAQCGDSGPYVSLVTLDPATGLDLWLGVVPCQGLNLIWVGTFWDLSAIGAADVMGGSVLGAAQGTSFGFEGIANPQCTHPIPLNSSSHPEWRLLNR